MTVSATTTFKAIAYASGYTNSGVATAVYNILAATPIFTPGGGDYLMAQTVTLSTTTSSASIRYTTDGSTPTATLGTVYSGPVTVSATTTVKATAYATGYTNSGVASAVYNILVATPTFSPGGGNYLTAQTVTIGTATGGASIRYTTDGTTPTATLGTVYSEPLTVSATTTIKATAYASGYTNSGVASAVYNILAATPTFSPGSGNYLTAQTVTLSTATGGASIRYTTDGTTPTATLGTVYSGPLTVSATTTIKATAYASGYTNSGVASAVYNILAATPSFSPGGGNYLTAQTVTLSTPTAEAAIRYTTDGSTPSDTAGTVYSGPVTVSATTTVKATAYATGYTNSGVASAVYNILAATPSFSPGGGNYLTAQTVTLSTTTAGAAIRYTTDGSTPSDTAGTVYSGPVTVSATTTIKAAAYASGYTNSGVATAVYNILAATPTFSPRGGNYSTMQTVTLSTTMTGAAIRYTTDGSPPSDTFGIVYSVPVTVSATTTLKAVAYASGYTNSGVAMAVYTITLPPPSITGLSPTSGAAGVQVAISGSGFGSVQSMGIVWLGSTSGTVVSWSDTQVVATVASNSTSGTAQVKQNGAWSNAVPFNVNTATISNVTPASGVPGTQVTITGTGFSAAQGSGQVWLGTMNGVVQSWSDTQVVAAVAPGSTSGSARVLQNSVMSNAVAFNLNSLHITGVDPASGLPGTSVTITGTGFGFSQGTGAVLLGSTGGQVLSWSDTQVVAAVALSAVTGIARIQQNGVWSNALGFTVPVTGGNTLVPNLLNLVVGDTHTIQASGPAGQPVTGLSWTSSDPTLVSLSGDDPPLLSALAAGHVTITAGSASADVTVSAGALPLGTVLWSNPGNGSGVTSIMPAVPSPTGVADVFAFQADGTVQAITSDGVTAWATDASYWGGVPDFQGGLIVGTYDYSNGQGSIMKLDGITGQPYPAYQAYGVGLLAVHTDGTIFAIESGVTVSVSGIDPTTGTQKFSVLLEARPYEGVFDLIIAGDGYAYVPYYYEETPDHYVTIFTHLMLLRIDSDGVYDNIKIKDWMTRGPFGLADGLQVHMITNADKGVLLNWYKNSDMHGNMREAATVSPGRHRSHQGISASGLLPKDAVMSIVEFGMAITTGASASIVTGPQIPGQVSAIVPVLQAQDGSFVGEIDDRWDSADGYQYNMIAFDATGTVRWSVPNERPQIATDDGGVIGQSGATYDRNGNATGQNANLNGNQSPGWLGNVLGTAYSVTSGAVSSVTAPTMNYATTFAALAGGNASGQGTAIQQVLTKLPQDGTKQLPNLAFPVCYPLPIPRLYLTPTCGNINAIELLTSATPDSIFQTFIQNFAPVTPLANPRNSVMTFTGPGNTNTINVTGPGQTLTIGLRGWRSLFQDPFSVMTERFDAAAHTISVVTLAGHPLAGWRYWRVYSIGTNDVVIETGAYDQPAPGTLNYAGYYLANRAILQGWQEYLQYIKTQLHAPRGSNLGNTLGGIKFKNYSWPDGPPLKGYWDYFGDFTQYILNNVCQSASCN